MTNGQPKHHNDFSTSSASSSSQKRKEYRIHDYDSDKANNKVTRVGAGDVSQSDPLISLLANKSLERTPFRTLLTNGSQIT